MDPRQHYVYVYIDPRDYEEFYYGKGKGNRKKSHLKDTADSEKTRRIRDIRRDGLEPIVRVVAAGLTEEEAYLIEATLIWKLGRNLTNNVGGRYSDRFRPQKTLHKHLPGFDSQNQIYYFNVGEGKHRNWDDCRKYGFISAGGGPKWVRQVRDELVPGDIIVAYLRRHGFVGIGKVIAAPVPYHQFLHQNRPLHYYGLHAKEMPEYSGDLDRCEWPATVEWLKSVPREQAKWKRNAGLFTTQLVKASLNKQPKTMQFLEDSFGINFSEL